jgi:hypothetical protein
MKVVALKVMALGITIVSEICKPSVNFCTDMSFFSYLLSIDNSAP